jgi:hypothetical protein
MQSQKPKARSQKLPALLRASSEGEQAQQEIVNLERPLNIPRTESIASFWRQENIGL